MIDKALKYKNIPDNLLSDDELRIKYWKELLQPSDPRFFEVYGKQIEENEKKRLKRIKDAEKMWEKAEIKKRIKNAIHYKTKNSKVLE